jgi:hypothetical protein
MCSPHHWLWGVDDKTWLLEMTQVQTAPLIGSAERVGRNGYWTQLHSAPVALQRESEKKWLMERTQLHTAPVALQRQWEAMATGKDPAPHHTAPMALQTRQWEVMPTGKDPAPHCTNGSGETVRSNGYWKGLSSTLHEWLWRNSKR